MAKREKRIEALRSNPRTVHPEELDVILRSVGFVVAGQKGSHRRYRRGADALVVPQHDPLDVAYVKQALDLIDQDRSSIDEEG